MSGLSINTQPNIRAATWKELVEARKSPEARKYEEYVESYRSCQNSSDPKKRQAWEAQSKFYSYLSPGEVHTDKALTNMSVMYANDEFIGTRLMPILNVDKQTDKFWKYSKRDRLGAPDDAIGDRGEANEITQSRSTDSYKCEGRALKGAIPETTVLNQDNVLNELVDLNETTNELLALKREKRLADILTTAGSYSGNTTAVTSWLNGAGNPIADVHNAHEQLWQGMGRSKLVGFTSLSVFHQLARHAMLLDLFKYSGSLNASAGLITAKMMADIFGLDDLLVGKARQDTANDGQTASYSRIWGNVFGIVRVAERPSRQNAAFGYTFRWNLKSANVPRTIVWKEETQGVAGVHYVQPTFSEDEKIVAPDTSYLLTGVIA